ncbi:hypothetical protein O1611_g4456 [Lasiodiplodia mahajangana]|uniref:Uncharacterized protein n=1 Tax=Lasiodiplodia mahajangana TaxID=1108764 RepID=A0ACC2JPL8_9PEZI|nr:hypothetical protein O1611_g4456 [Lasiodiplodia mahajangana]
MSSHPFVSFTCRVCGQKKAPAAFSKSQLQKWYNQKRNDRYNEVNPQNAGLSCKDHATDWCIICTEWRLSANGSDVPPPVPGASSQLHACDSIEDNNKSVNSPIPFSAQHENDEDDEDEDSDDEDDFGGSTAISGLIDRLQGYGGLADAGEGITADTMSTTNSVKISLWGEDTNDGKANSIGVSTGIQPWNVQNSGTRINAPTVSNPWGNTSHSQGYSSTASNATIPSTTFMATGVAPHLNRLASGANMNQQTQNAQTTWSRNLGESSHGSSSQFTAGRPPHERIRQNEIKRSTSTAVNRSPGGSRLSGSKTNMKSQESRKGTGSKWYKGDNRKVFTANRTYLPENGPPDPHDSDSPDEMDDVPARRSPAAGQASPSPGYYLTQAIAVATMLANVRHSPKPGYSLYANVELSIWAGDLVDSESLPINHPDMEAIPFQSNVGAKMTNGKPQHQGHPGSAALPSRSGPPVEHFTASRSPNSPTDASTAGDSDGNVQNSPLLTHVVSEQTEQKDPVALAQRTDPRPPLGSREISADLVDEIRKVIRQECKRLLRPVGE